VQYPHGFERRAVRAMQGRSSKINYYVARLNMLLTPDFIRGYSYLSPFGDITTLADEHIVVGIAYLFLISEGFYFSI
jgi:hypothetical protein